MSSHRSDIVLAESIRALKADLGARLALPAHHYQRPEIVALADYVGDSYKLAVRASGSDAEYIVLCGVRFMAESAAILASPGQTVMIPDTDAGCPMADMISAVDARAALAALDGILAAPAVPVTYMNSYADMKALTGERGGAVCTSGNAVKVMRHFLDAGRPVFFSPDCNLGINCSRALGVAHDRIFRIGRNGSIKGPGDPSRGLLFLWDGYCHVHTRFTPGDVAAARTRVPGITVIVHPECDCAVVEAADLSGSTEGIYEAVREGGPGSAWAIGTEANFVTRLASEFPDRGITPLRTSFCMNMAKTDLGTLEASISSITRHETGGSFLLHEIRVPPAERRDAAMSLRLMMDITEGRV